MFVHFSGTAQWWWECIYGPNSFALFEPIRHLDSAKEIKVEGYTHRDKSSEVHTVRHVQTREVHNVSRQTTHTNKT